MVLMSSRQLMLARLRLGFVQSSLDFCSIHPRNACPPFDAMLMLCSLMKNYSFNVLEAWYKAECEQME